MYTPAHIKTYKLGRRVFMAVNLQNKEMAIEGATEDFLRIFKSKFKRKPLDTNELTEWQEKFLWAEYYKILEIHKNEIIKEVK